MITTHYTVLTPCGAFVAHWDEDENLLPVFSGNSNAVEYFKAYLAATRPSGPMAACWRSKAWSRTSWRVSASPTSSASPYGRTTRR